MGISLGVMKFEHILGLIFFGITLSLYILFFLLGWKWRREYEAQGVTYWSAPKEDRIKELTEEIFRPRLIALFYGLAYFANGYSKITFSMWAPIFLVQRRNVDVFETALFLGLVYISWQWKMFIGMFSDAVPINFQGKKYRRMPLFFLTGVFSIIATIGFIVTDLNTSPLWTGFFPLCLAMTIAGALFDIAADSYAVDVTPPGWHARVLGGINTVGIALGGASASLLSPILIRNGGYQLVFISGGLVGLLAFLFLFLKEPELEHERVFSKQAIAFTFTEKSVLIASLIMMGASIGPRRISNPTGGMFSLAMTEIIGGFTPETVGLISVLVLLSGIPASLIGGWSADKYGHKRVFWISSLASILTGYLWMILGSGMATWFIMLAIISNFVERIASGGRMAIMADSTPLALSATVFQMYMSFYWVGNIPASVIVGYLLPRNIPLLFGVLSSFSILPLFLVRFLEPFDAGKAMKV
jgi:MFS family permease